MSIKKNMSYIPRRWTKQAVHCYKIGCMCDKCSYKVELESTDRCLTKQAVLELVRTIGKPTEYFLLLEDNLKRCPMCKKIKPLDEFHEAGNPSKSTYCRVCSNKIGKKYRDKKNGKIKI